MDGVGSMYTGVDAGGGRRTEKSGHAGWDTGRGSGHAGRHVWVVTGTHWVASRMPHTHILVGVKLALEFPQLLACLVQPLFSTSNK